MKNKYIIPCLLALALASGCIKEEGTEPFTITRKVNTVDDNGEGSIRGTIQTSSNAYMYGDAEKDSLVEKSFTHEFDDQNRLVLDCYVTLKSKFFNLNVARNAVKSAGYVYSRTNKKPVISKEDKNYFWVTDARGQVMPMDSTASDLVFEGTGHKLDFDVTYYMRSFVVSTKGDTIYNPHFMEVKTVLPHDVWIPRKDADLKTRTEAFVCQAGEKTYMYGGRSGSNYFDDLYEYDNVRDTWRQVASNDSDNKNKRCNGAAFAYKKSGDEYLIYIAGGKVYNHSLTSSVFFYDTKTNRFDNKYDHPNHGRMLPKYDDNFQPVFKKDKDGNLIEPEEFELIDGSREFVWPLPVSGNPYSISDLYGVEGCTGFVLKDPVLDKDRYFVAFGRSSAGNAGSVETTIYEYIVDNDRAGAPGPAWKTLSASLNGSVIGFYQPVCVTCDWRVVIGSGECSREKNNNVSGKFYTIEIDPSSTNKIIMRELMSQPPSSEFKPRANAAGFYLNYESEHQMYDCFYVGTGRTVKESEYTGFELTNDFWCFDFGTNTWSQKRNCSNIPRQGACGFSVLRQDDDYEKQGGSKLRGFISFGEGAVDKDGDGEVDEAAASLLDNWEYLP